MFDYNPRINTTYEKQGKTSDDNDSHDDDSDGDNGIWMGKSNFIE